MAPAKRGDGTPFGGVTVMPLAEPGTLQRVTSRARAIVTNGHAATFLVLGLAAGILFVTAPKSGDFWWSDAPRHALNGAFLRDVIVDLPLQDPKEYAVSYYLQYPALTILLYPIGFYVLLSIAFLIGGVSHWVAQLTVSACALALGLAVYRIASRAMPPVAASCAAVLLLSFPETALWGRQVMLEIPAFAFLAWAVDRTLSFRETGRPAALYGAALLMVCALHTKISVVFAVPVLMAALVTAAVAHRSFRWRHAVFAGLLLVAGIVPLIWMTMAFGQVNLQSASGIPDAEVSRRSLDGWVWYATRIPAQVGWPSAVLAVTFWLLSPWRRSFRRPPYLHALLLAWFAAGYIFFSLIDLKEARHSVFLLLPVAVWAMSVVATIRTFQVQALVAFALACGTLVATLLWHPVPRVDGYEAAAAYIVKHAPEHGVVLFSGKRDGSFIFAVRAHPERRDLSVVRADKLLLKVAVRRSMGVETIQRTEAELVELLSRLGVSYVVAQTSFWTDLDSMKTFEETLRSPHFEEVARIDVNANVPVEEKELRIYRPVAPPSPGPHELDLELRVIGKRLRGRVGRR